MNRPSVTICICVRDGERTLSRILEALLPQARRHGIAVRTVNHLSKDGTAAILAAFKIQYSEIMTVANFSGEGLGRVRNFAWRDCQTDWVAFIDADCEAVDDWLDCLLAAIISHEANSDVGAIGGSNAAPETGDFYRDCGVMLNSWIGGHNSTLNRTKANARRVQHLPTLNIVYRRRALVSVNGFDERFLRVAEDLDLSRRLVKNNWQMIFDPRFRAIHWFREGWLAWLKNMWLYGMGRALYLEVHPDDRELKFYLPIAILGITIFTAGSFLVSYGILVFLLLALPNNEFSFSGLRATVLTIATHLIYALGMLSQWNGNGLRFDRSDPSESRAKDAA